ncbi:hypothetical protein XU18_5090 [Perkinsela sp. CCAP 1560/4]|nr:hypothetical protein XU18_5090 [Perkinsela sp. CCAP 1560/4]|eukprot:KNH01722.1 hypothetical protein XU18_5090 [Perkinsela sp. CCAP 1560/4]
MFFCAQAGAFHRTSRFRRPLAAITYGAPYLPPSMDVTNFKIRKGRFWAPTRGKGSNATQEGMRVLSSGQNFSLGANISAFPPPVRTIDATWNSLEETLFLIQLPDGFFPLRTILFLHEKSIYKYILRLFFLRLCSKGILSGYCACLWVVWRFASPSSQMTKNFSPFSRRRFCSRQNQRNG